jgi:hypothetical protein
MQPTSIPAHFNVSCTLEIDQQLARILLMATITIQEAQAKLPDLIHNLKPGEELMITENN